MGGLRDMVEGLGAYKHGGSGLIDGVVDWRVKTWAEEHYSLTPRRTSIDFCPLVQNKS
jgi:hypothetical protein